MTPLFKKLGLKACMTIQVINFYGNYEKLIYPCPFDLKTPLKPQNKSVDFLHLFVEDTVDLDKYFELAKASMAKDGMLWISWPKGMKNANINRDVIRAYGLAKGLVDVKVASIDDYWSALKFVYRLTDR